MTSFDLDLSKYDLGWSDSVEYAFTPDREPTEKERALLIELAKSAPARTH